VLSQVEIAEREQELIKNIELIRQKMVKSTYEAAQIVIELNNDLAELEVRNSVFSILNTKLELFLEILQFGKN
jgi:hypothetical protein